MHVNPTCTVLMEEDQENFLINQSSALYPKVYCIYDQ